MHKKAGAIGRKYSATIKVFGSSYSPGETAVVYAQVLDEAGEPANAATVTLDIFKSDGTKFLDSAVMDYISDSSGIYKYQFTAPADAARMLVDVKVTNPTAYGSEEVSVTAWALDTQTTRVEIDKIQHSGVDEYDPERESLEAIREAIDKIAVKLAKGFSV